MSDIEKKLVEIRQDAYQVLVFKVHGGIGHGGPLVVSAFGEKAMAEIRTKQEAGGKATKKHEPKDFDKAYRDAFHLSTDGWWGVDCMSFKHALIDAVRVASFDATMVLSKMCIRVLGDGRDARQAWTELVRIEGEPEMFVAPVRNKSGVADLRARPMWKDWTATVRVRFNTKINTAEQIAELMMHAGECCGICEGRMTSKDGIGMGWGGWELDETVVA